MILRRRIICLGNLDNKRNLNMKNCVSLLSLIFLTYGCTKEPEPPKPPTLTTIAITEISPTEISSGGDISSDGGAFISSRGVVWGTTPLPTVEGNKTNDGTGNGRFTSVINGLLPGTSYFFRAYAINVAGISYGNEVSFTTSAQLAVLTTGEISEITPTSAQVTVTVVSDGGAEIINRGIVWHTAPEPTLAHQKKEIANGGDNFTADLMNLEPDTEYFVRSFATNSVGTAYGNSLTFTTEALSIINDETEIYNPALSYGEVEDIDGNVYRTIQIGNQVWMAENLRATRYCNGEEIPNVVDSAQWINLTEGGWAYYQNDSSYNYPHGKLYNWFVASDSRNPCPCGWHVPLDVEWTVLRKVLDNQSGSTDNINSAGGKMKVTGTKYWLEWNQGATNESGFSALPAGGRNGEMGYFNGKGSLGSWYSSESATDKTAWQRAIFNYSRSIDRNPTPKSDGFSIRCLKD